MRFGPVPVLEAAGCILAHSLVLPGGRLKKGAVLTAQDVTRIADSGLAEITVVTLSPDDLDEDSAASAIAARLVAPGLDATDAFTGRVNIVARNAGLIRIDAASIHALNGVDEAITVATLPDHARVEPGTLVATIKIIPYAVAQAKVAMALAALGPQALTLCPNRVRTADLILTRTHDLKPSLLKKAQGVTEARLTALSVQLQDTVTVDHDVDAVAGALARGQSDMVLILGASATSDRADVAPAGLVRAGGELHRFGMPVDPGNLLFTGTLNGRPVIGLPGCARSPALNGADWVLDRIVAGLAVTDADIAAMGVGGLLKESPARHQPRRAPPVKGRRVEVIVLAAGAARRMRGEDKLLRPIAGKPLLRHATDAALASRADRVHVVLPEGNAARRAALDGSGAHVVETVDWREGMAGSLRAGLRNVGKDTAAVVVAFADMPEVSATHIDALIAAFDPVAGHEICRAETADGQAGHPVLFSRRFFENLADLSGDRGARDILALAPEMVVTVPTPGTAAVVDLDTPEAWLAWEKRRDGAE